MKTIRSGAICVAALWCCAAQTSDYPPEQENTLQRTRPGRQLFKEDEPCGNYLWRSDKAERGGAMVLYYFYGSTEYGKAKIGMYLRSKFHAEVGESKDPPTAQVIRDGRHNVREVRIRMTAAEYEAARPCFP